MAAPLAVADGIGPQVPKRKALVEGIGPQVDGLPKTLEVLLRTAAGDPNYPEPEQRRLLRASLLPLVVQKLRVRDAGRFLQLTRLPLADANPHGNRILPNGEVVEKLAEAADVLLLIQEPLRRTRRPHPTDRNRLRLVEASAIKLRELAREAGGSFKSSSNDFVDRVLLFVHDARTHLPFSSFVPLISSLDDVVHHAKVLLDLTVTLKHPNPAEAAAAAMEAAADAAAYEAVEEEEDGAAAEAEEGAGGEAEA